MQLGLSSDEIALMLVDAGDRMEKHYEEITKQGTEAGELSRLLSSLMVTVSANVRDIVLANNEKLRSDLQELGLLK